MRSNQPSEHGSHSPEATEFVHDHLCMYFVSAMGYTDRTFVYSTFACGSSERSAMISCTQRRPARRSWRMFVGASGCSAAIGGTCTPMMQAAESTNDSASSAKAQPI